MDTLIQSLIQTVSDQSWFGIVTSLVALCSAIAAITPTPAPGTTLGKLYSILDFLALNIGKAKSTGTVAPK